MAMATDKKNDYPPMDVWPYPGYPLFRFNIDYLVFVSTLGYDPYPIIDYLRDLFVKEAIREWPAKYKDWGLFISVIINDKIPLRFKVMGPSRVTIDKIASFGLHVHPGSFDHKEKPSIEFINVVFDAMEDLYATKFKMPNPNLVSLREEAVSYIFLPSLVTAQ